MEVWARIQYILQFYETHSHLSVVSTLRDALVRKSPDTSPDQKLVDQIQPLDVLFDLHGDLNFLSQYLVSRSFVYKSGSLVSLKNIVFSP